MRIVGLGKKRNAEAKKKCNLGVFTITSELKILFTDHLDQSLNF